MKVIPAPELRAQIQTQGRCYFDAESGLLYFNWTGASLKFRFQGELLMADLPAIHGDEPVFGFPKSEPTMRPTWPMVGVIVDGDVQNARKYALTGPENRVLLYSGTDAKPHTIEVVKLTENYKTFAALRAVRLEGEILPAEAQNSPGLEVIGDSITCGFGNLADNRTEGFLSCHEDAMHTYGYLAAQSLGLGFSALSFSGISTARYGGEIVPYAMEELYPFTDRLVCDKLGHSSPEPWNFQANPNAAVVVNLGTNDAHAAITSGHSQPERLFAEGYLRFLKALRTHNGPKTKIVCTLGSMNYYFYDDILRLVEGYCRDTGDREVYCMKYRPMHYLDGFGACDHPSAKTHQKMADELASFLRGIL